MANKKLFATVPNGGPLASMLPNRVSAPAYAYEPRHKLAQLACTGTLAGSFYASAEEHLREALDAARAVDPLFVAKAAVYARKAGLMKDMPALLAAHLTMADPDLAVSVFARVIDNGRMLRSFVQIMRSGQIGRRSLGTRPKRLVKGWLEHASMRDLMAAATGADPSLADIVRMTHPAPSDATRRAFYGWLVGKPYDVGALPPEIATFERWKQAPEMELPPVPFEWLTAYKLSGRQWARLVSAMGWQALRMNLNKLLRSGAFEEEGVVAAVAARLADPTAITKARVWPVQLLMTLKVASTQMPAPIVAALEQALEISLESLPVLAGRVVVCPDVSGSMRSALTGNRKGGTSAVRCVDAAALVAVAMMRRNPQARVMPFENTVVHVALEAPASIAVNAARLAAVGGGGTSVSAPLAKLNAEEAGVDLVIIVSDNQSWVDAGGGKGTATMAEWERLKRRNPDARLICLDVQPYGTTQAAGRPDILNIGGFSDVVFTQIARFARGEQVNWVSIVEAVEI